ncbi:max-binding protein MNT-like isoform X2 [Dysidea avara]|uniref:max-binding protein MNT-like isoform X2 n=1 Tax=Dysidea avara TaxID=196820 RepID=UPI00332CC369
MVEDDRDIDIETDGDDEMGVSKRYHHNELERKRRDHIKDSFSLLRDVVPAVAGEKISRALILNKASDFIKEMKIKNQQHEEEIETLRQSNFILEEQVKLLQKSRSSGSTESAEKILQSLSGQISEKMKNYNASRPTWEEKNAQIASRLQNSILTQNLSVKSAQNFMDKFVHKQGSNNIPSPSSLIEPSSYYAAPEMSSVEPQTSPDDDDDSVASSSSRIPVNVPTSTMTAKPIKANLAGMVVASPIVSGSGGKVPRGVVTATPVTTQNNTTAQQAPPQQQNPTAINLANALKALAAQSLRVQQLKKIQGETSTSTAMAIEKKPTTSDKAQTTANRQVPIPVAMAEIPTTPATAASNPVTTDVWPVESLPKAPEVNKPTPKLVVPAQTTVPISIQQLAATTSNIVTQESADSTVLESATQVSLNAILGTNLSPEAERLLNALITSLQPQSQSGGQQQQQTLPATVQTVPIASVVSSATPPFSNTVSSQATPQYAPFPSSGTRAAMTEQVPGNSGSDHFIEHDTTQLLQTPEMVDDPLSDSGDLSHLCDLDAFTASSDTDNKRPLELSDSLFTGTSLKRPRMDSDF